MSSVAKKVAVPVATDKGLDCLVWDVTKNVIFNWPERIKTQPHDVGTIVFCRLTQRDPAV